MDVMKVRKNFLLDKALVERAQTILLRKHKNLTEAVTTYLRAVVKDPQILDTIEETSKKRTGAFIGMLDGKIGAQDAKAMRQARHKRYE